MSTLASRLKLALIGEALYIVEQGITSAQDGDTAVRESNGRELAVAGLLKVPEVQNRRDIIPFILVRSNQKATVQPSRPPTRQDSDSPDQEWHLPKR